MMERRREDVDCSPEPRRKLRSGRAVKGTPHPVASRATRSATQNTSPPRLGRLRFRTPERRTAEAERRELFKLPHFDGTGDVLYFINRFEDVREANEWPNEVTRLHLRAALRDAATDCGQADTVDRIYAALRARFGVTARDAWNKLANLRRDYETSLEEHSTEISRLVDVAHEELPYEYRRRMALETFLKTLENPYLQCHLWTVLPGTMDEAVQAGNAYLHYINVGGAPSEHPDLIAMRIAGPVPRRLYLLNQFEELVSAPQDKPGINRRARLIGKTTKAPHIDGTGDINHQIHRFEYLRKRHKWSPKEALHHLRTSLHGDALQCKVAETVEDTYTRLRIHYGTANREGLYQKLGALCAHLEELLLAPMETEGDIMRVTKALLTQTRVLKKELEEETWNRISDLKRRGMELTSTERYLHHVHTVILPMTTTAYQAMFQRILLKNDALSRSEPSGTTIVLDQDPLDTPPKIVSGPGNSG